MTSRLAEIQARFQQKQMQEREEKLLRMYESQQQRVFERVSRGSAGSNSSVTSTSTTGGKVRQMFDERRQKAGVDRSYPLEPIRKANGVSKPNGLKTSPASRTTTRTLVKTSVQNSVSQVKNGNALVNKSSLRETVYNNNGGEESYQERVFERDDLDNGFLKSSGDLVTMMNDHNLNDTLDEEVPPTFHEPEEPFVAGKLANLGGKLPSENGSSKRAVPYSVAETAKSPAAKKEAKPIVKKTIFRAVAPSYSSSKSSLASTSSPQDLPKPPSPRKTQSMNNRAQQPPKMASAQSAPTPKAPSSSRPSARQGPKSAVARDDLDECRYCGRRFAGDRLQVHEDICSKTGKKKRKVYDATKHRVQGTELEPFVKKGKGTPQSSKSAKRPLTKGNWRQKHEEFIAAIRAAKMAQDHIAKGGKISDLPPPPPSSNPDYVQCPHCGRKFNETAAERHIPKCATYLHNKPKPGAVRPPARR